MSNDIHQSCYSNSVPEPNSGMTGCFRMPKYLFKLDDGEFLGDTNGTELPNLDAARERAGELARTVAQNADFRESCSIAVMGENERPLMTIAFPKLLR